VPQRERSNHPEGGNKSKDDEGTPSKEGMLVPIGRREVLRDGLLRGSWGHIGVGNERVDVRQLGRSKTVEGVGEGVDVVEPDPLTGDAGGCDEESAEEVPRSEKEGGEHSADLNLKDKSVEE
jgi:hypothetical protein